MRDVLGSGSLVIVVSIAVSACAQSGAPAPAYGPPRAPQPYYAGAPAPQPYYAGAPAPQAWAPPPAPAAPVTDPSRLLGSALTLWGWVPPGGSAPVGPPPSFGAPSPAPPGGYVGAAPAGTAPAWPMAIPTSIPWSAIPGFTAPPQAPVPGAVPPAPSSGRPASWDQLEQEVFTETNARRAQGAVCGSTPFPPAPPLAIHPALQRTAREHSLDMANRNYFEHATPEGQGPGPRSRANGYTGVFTGENIAAHAVTAREVVDLWMSSTDGHCHNIMDERYHYFGAGYAENAASTYQRYWTQNFGP